MATYTIEEVEHKRNFGAGSQYGEKAVYKVTLLDSERQPAFVEVKQKVETPPPEVGKEVEGEILPAKGSFLPEFKRAWAGSPQQSGATFKPVVEGLRPQPFRKHPAEVAGARRAHAQHMAIMWVAVLQKNPQTAPENPNFEYLRGVVSWFDEDAKKAAEGAE